MSSITNTQIRELNTLLFSATKEGNVPEIERCLNQGANVFATQESETLLQVAADQAEERVAQVILNHIKKMQKTSLHPISIDQHINTQDKNDRTPLIRAASLGNLETVRILLQYGARIDAYFLKQLEDGPVKKLLLDYKSSFFNMPFKHQLMLAIDNEDPKLVQLILGSKFCQLWQYWFAHAIIVYQMLTVEKTIECELPIEIVQQQKDLLNTALQFLRARKKDLEKQKEALPLTEEEEALTNINQLVAALSTKASEVIEEYSQNNTITPQIEFTSVNIAIANDNHPTIPEYTTHALRNVVSVIQSNYEEELRMYAEKVKKLVTEQINQTMSLSTTIGHYANQANECISGESGRIIQQGFHLLPDNRHAEIAQSYFTLFGRVLSIFQWGTNMITNDLSKPDLIKKK